MDPAEDVIWGVTLVAFRRLADMGYTATDVDCLGDKLDSMNFNDGERAALHALLTFAARRPADLDGLVDPTGQVHLRRVLQDLLFEQETL